MKNEKNSIISSVLDISNHYYGGQQIKVVAAETTYIRMYVYKYICSEIKECKN